MLILTLYANPNTNRLLSQNGSGNVDGTIVFLYDENTSLRLLEGPNTLPSGASSSQQTSKEMKPQPSQSKPKEKPLKGILKHVKADADESKPPSRKKASKPPLKGILKNANIGRKESLRGGVTSTETKLMETKIDGK
jgi:hypothetical protein